MLFRLLPEAKDLNDLTQTPIFFFSFTLFFALNKLSNYVLSNRGQQYAVCMHSSLYPKVRSDGHDCTEKMFFFLIDELMFQTHSMVWWSPVRLGGLIIVVLHTFVHLSVALS